MLDISFKIYAFLGMGDNRVLCAPGDQQHHWGRTNFTGSLRYMDQQYVFGFCIKILALLTDNYQQGTLYPMRTWLKTSPTVAKFS